MSAANIGTAVTSSNSATTTNTSLVVTLGSTTVGDLNIIEISGLANGTTVNPTMTTPSGWTKLFERIDTNGTPASFVAVYYRFFAGGDGSTVTISWTNQGQMIAVCTPWQNAEPTTPIPYSVSDFKVASDVNYSIAGTTSGAQGYLCYGFANRTGTAWSSLSDTNRAQVGITSSATMTSQVTSAEVTTGTVFSKTGVGSNTSVGVSWAYTVAGSSGTTVTPAVVSGSASVGTATIFNGATPTPAVVAGVVAVATPTINFGTTAKPVVVSAVTAVAAPSVGVIVNSTVTPSVVSGHATVGSVSRGATVVPSTHIASGTALNPNNQTNTSLAVPDPASVQVNDLLVVDLTTYQPTTATNTVTPPAGWTQIGPGIVDLGTDGVQLTSWYRVVQTGDPTTRTWTWATASQSVAVISIERNVDPISPVSHVSEIAQVASSTSRPTGSITTTATERIRAVFADRSGSAWSALADTVRGTATNTASISMVAEETATAPNAGTYSKSATASVGSAVGVSAIYSFKDASSVGITASTNDGLLELTQGWAANSTGSVAVSSTVVSFAAAIAGNTLLVAATSENTVNTPAGWTLVASQVGVCATYLWRKTAAGGETSVTLTPTTSSAMVTGFSEVKGILSSAPVDTTGSATSGTTSLTSGNAVTSSPAAYLVSVFGTAGTAPTSIGAQSNSFVEQLDARTTKVSGTNVDMSLGTQRVQSSGLYSTSATAAGTVTGGVGLIAAFTLDTANTQPRPVTVPGVTTVGNSIPVPQVNTTVTPAKVSGVTAVPPVSIAIPGITTIAAVTVLATTTITEIVDLQANSTVSPATVQGTTTVPNPTQLGSGISVVTILADTVMAPVAVPTPTFSIGASAFVTPQTVLGEVDVLGPGIDLGVATTVTPATVLAVAAAPLPQPLAGVQFGVQTVRVGVAIPGIQILTPTPIFIFSPPTVDEGPLADGPLFGRMTLPRGITVTRTGTTFTQIRWPTQDELDAADFVYRGGYENPISREEMDALTAAGYGSYIHSEDAPS